MVDTKKTVGISILSAIFAGLIVLGGVSLTDKNVYYCEPTKIVMECTSLQTYYGLINGKCINEQVGNKLCRQGWRLVMNDIDLSSTEINKNFVVDQRVGISEWSCDFDKCVKVK